MIILTTYSLFLTFNNLNSVNATNNNQNVNQFISKKNFTYFKNMLNFISDNCDHRTFSKTYDRIYINLAKNLNINKIDFKIKNIKTILNKFDILDIQKITHKVCQDLKLSYLGEVKSFKLKYSDDTQEKDCFIDFLSKQLAKNTDMLPNFGISYKSVLTELINEIELIENNMNNDMNKNLNVSDNKFVLYFDDENNPSFEKTPSSIKNEKVFINRKRNNTNLNNFDKDNKNKKITNISDNKIQIVINNSNKNNNTSNIAKINLDNELDDNDDDKINTGNLFNSNNNDNSLNITNVLNRNIGMPTIFNKNDDPLNITNVLNRNIDMPTIFNNNDKSESRKLLFPIINRIDINQKNIVNLTNNKYDIRCQNPSMNHVNLNQQNINNVADNNFNILTLPQNSNTNILNVNQNMNFTNLFNANINNTKTSNTNINNDKTSNENNNNKN